LIDYDRINRRELIKRAGTLTAVAAGAPLIAACGSSSSSSSASGSSASSKSSDTLAAAQKAGTIKIGFAIVAPYAFTTASGQATGEAPSVAREAMKLLGVPKMNGVVVEFGSLIPGLQAGRFDMVASGLYITPARCQQVLFSNPDFVAPLGLTVRKGNPLHIETLQDVVKSGAKVGVVAGTVEPSEASSIGVKSSNVQVYADSTSRLEGLAVGRVDVIFGTALEVRWAIQTTSIGNKVELLSSFLPVVNGKTLKEGGGYAFRKSDASFCDSFNTALRQMQNDGTLQKLVEPFGFGPNEVDPAKSLTASELCKTG
jgi:polar amino acid transport system substrate-binding protein